MTEKRTKAEIDGLADAYAKALALMHSAPCFLDYSRRFSPEYCREPPTHIESSCTNLIDPRCSSSPAAQAVARRSCPPRMCPKGRYRRSSPIRTQLDRSPPLPELGELDVVRHYTNLSTLNMSIDSNFYPLGSCTMKYNPKRNERLAGLPGLSAQHPYQDESTLQGLLAILFDLQRILAEIAGLRPSACSRRREPRESSRRCWSPRLFFAIAARRRTQVLIPDSAHGTNPASAHLAGFEAITIKSDSRGLVDLADFKAKLSDQTAVFMMTNPNTVGLFDPQIGEIARLIHERGALLYLDGANMNAILGIVRPGDMGVDLMHYNPHKTFSGPHGGGGPGAGPIAVRGDLAPFLPAPVVARDADGVFRLDHDRPRSIGRVRCIFREYGRPVPSLLLHPQPGPRRTEAHRRERRPERELSDVSSQRRLPCAVRQPVHARVRRVGPHARQGSRHPGHGYRQAADRLQLPCADGLFSADRFGGSDDRADRVGEPRDARGIRQGAAHDRRGRPAAPPRCAHTTPISRPDEVKAAKTPVLKWKPK